MVLGQECRQKPAENFCQEEGQRGGKDFLLKKSMTKLESLKKSSHFQTVLKHRVANSDLFTIYRTKNFIKKSDCQLYLKILLSYFFLSAVYYFPFHFEFCYNCLLCILMFQKKN